MHGPPPPLELPELPPLVEPELLLPELVPPELPLPELLPPEPDDPELLVPLELPDDPVEPLLDVVAPLELPDDPPGPPFGSADAAQETSSTRTHG